MRAGICKIVPPEGWRPPFAINERSFRFRTRVQQLNCIDAHSRAEKQFVDALRMFLYRRGTPMRALPRVDGQLVNLRLLFQAVTDLGGFAAVSRGKQWPAVVRRVGRTRAAGEPTDELCKEFQSHYEELLLAYEEEQTQPKATPEPKTVDAEPAKRGVMETPTTNAPSTSSVDKELSEATTSTAQSLPAATPMAKSRSSMKKTRRRSLSNEDDTEGTHADGGVRVKRTLFSESASSDDNDSGKFQSPTKRVKQDASIPPPPASLEPAALKPSPKRTYCLDPPVIHAGQRFYRFFPETGAIMTEVKRVLGGKKPHAHIRYVEDGAMDDVELSMLQILVANGWDASAAELGYKSEICQACLRGDCSNKMLLCDGCDGGYHLFCLEPPLKAVPEGDWYCEACVEQAAVEAKDEKAAKQRATFGFEMGAETALAAYIAKADAWKRQYFGFSDGESEMPEVSDLELEKEYWRILGTPAHEQRLEVEYGSDVDSGAVGSGFPRLDTYMKCLRFIEKRWKKMKTESKNTEPLFSHGLRDVLKFGESLEELLSKYANDGWNLNNLPKLPGSVLQHLDEDIKGVMVPWIYMGMCFSTFCWHVEDHNFYSISYLHCGAPKTWYGVPSEKADKFEATMRELTPELFGKQPDLHLQMVTMFSPKTLREHGVPVYRATQRPNEFVVTFPSAYHGGFNNGFNCAEAVNFSTIDWLPWGSKSIANYRQYKKLPVFCHEALVCSLSETLADGESDGNRGESIDAELGKTYLLPAMQKLRDDFERFEAIIAASPVTRRGKMAEFEQFTQTGGSVGASTLASSTRRSMASRMNARMGANDPCVDDQTIEDESADVDEKVGMKRRKLEGKMMASSPPAASMKMRRPSRMVLWAGRSGKHEGLRCATCKQYCFLQAVACTRCALRLSTEAHRAVACIDHVADRCKCDPEQHYIYLYRYERHDLDALLYRMRSKLKRVDDWNAACEDIFISSPGIKVDADAMEIDDIKTDKKKPDVFELESLLKEGRRLGLKSTRLVRIENAINEASAWSTRASEVLIPSPLSHQPVQPHNDSKNRSGAISPRPVVSWIEVKNLMEEANRLVATPSTGLDRIQRLATRWQKAEASSNQVLDQVASIQRKESAGVSDFALGSHYTMDAARNVVVTLDQQNEALRDVLDDIADARDKVTQLSLDVGTAMVTLLDRATAYVEVLSGANSMVAAAACRLATSNRTPSSPNEVVRVGEAECRALVDEADSLRLDQPDVIRKIEILRSLLRASQHGADELAAALAVGRVLSAEELAALLERAQKLPILPERAEEVATRLSQCRSWESHASELLRGSSGRKPPFEEVEAFFHTADEHFVPASSLLRRQLHSRVQDAKRWQSNVASLFLRPSGSRMELDTFFSRALSRLEQCGAGDGGSDALFARWRVHCVCEQVLNDHAPMVTCSRCSRYFHPVCVGIPESRKSFTCHSCRHDENPTSQQTFQSPPGVFCSCRGPEMLPMVCCDFCDEWYHGGCVGMREEDMNRVESYRCPRCAVRQRVAYIDQMLAASSTVCEGRRPALAKVRALLAQYSSQLIAVPPGAGALVTYMTASDSVVSAAQAYTREFSRSFSPRTFAQMDGNAEQQRVAKMLEQLAILEVAPATSRQLEADGNAGEEEDVVTSLRAIHWCLRACSLLLGNDHAPKYSHLVVLLEDASRIRRLHEQPRGQHMHPEPVDPNSKLPAALLPPFAPAEFSRIQQTIIDLVARAGRWLSQVKVLEVEEWNIGRAHRLRAEYGELVQFLELPAPEVKLVHDVASGSDSTTSVVENVVGSDSVMYTL